MPRARSQIVQEIATIRTLLQEINVFNLRQLTRQVEVSLHELLHLVQRTPRVEVSWIRTTQALRALSEAVQRDASELVERKLNAAIIVFLKRLEDFEDALVTGVPVHEAHPQHLKGLEKPSFLHP